MPTMRMPCSASAGNSSPSDEVLEALLLVDHALADRVDRLRRRQAVGPGLGEAGVDLVVDAGDADLEELVEVRAPDRGQLHALEQRHATGPRRAAGRGR